MSYVSLPLVQESSDGTPGNTVEYLQVVEATESQRSEDGQTYIPGVRITVSCAIRHIMESDFVPRNGHTDAAFAQEAFNARSRLIAQVSDQVLNPGAGHATS